MITDSQAWFMIGFLVGGFVMGLIWIFVLRNYKLNKQEEK